jgi:hypothetical protein
MTTEHQIRTAEFGEPIHEIYEPPSFADEVTSLHEVCELLDRYAVKTIPPNEKRPEPMVVWFCARCNHVQIVARDLDGNQDGMTLAELAEAAIEHEQESHDDAPEPVGESA